MAYMNTPHLATREKSSKLLFGRDLQTKLPSYPTQPKGKHHNKARKKDKEAKEKQKVAYNNKKRTKPPWQPKPFIIYIVQKIRLDQDGSHQRGNPPLTKEKGRNNLNFMVDPYNFDLKPRTRQRARAEKGLEEAKEIVGQILKELLGRKDKPEPEGGKVQERDKTPNHTQPARKVLPLANEYHPTWQGTLSSSHCVPNALTQPLCGTCNNPIK